MKAYIDFETFSTVDLADAGAHAYAEHPDTGIYWLCYALGDGPVQSWRPGMPFPEDLVEWVEAGKRVVAHNAAFEFHIWNEALRSYDHLAPPLHIEQLDDTMARGLALALPASLGELARVLNLDTEKDTEGRRLMLQMCKPKPLALKKGKLEYYDDEERRERLRVYCVRDVEVEREIDKLLPALSPNERNVWELDRHINGRGVALDLVSIDAAQRVALEETEASNAELATLTGGEVKAVSNAKALTAWLACQPGGERDPIRLAAARLGETVAPPKFHVPDVTKATVEALLREPELDPVARRVLEIRQDTGKASVAKFKAMAAAVSGDGRARDLLAYGGAGRTLRWAGRRVQPQNFPRPEIEQDEIDAIINVLGLPFARYAIKEVYGAPVKRLADCLRGMLVAEDGQEFVAADLSNIEGRGAAWLAGEGWKVQAFRDFDAGIGHDLYKVAYARAFGIDPAEVTKLQRQIGKVMELFLQYQGAFGAFSTGAEGYGFAILKDGTTPPSDGRPFLFEDQCHDIVNAWRDAHPVTCAFWRELETCAIWALRNPGKTCETKNGKIRFVHMKRFLYMILPSGRPLAYFNARLGEKPNRSGAMVPAIQYEGMNSYTHKWDIIDTYGGKLFENAVQALARDVLAAGLFNAEARGMPVVLHVHDEIVTECPAGKFTPKDLETAMCELPAWAEGLPVAASGWAAKRYQK